MGILRKYYFKKDLPEPNFFIGGSNIEYPNVNVLGNNLFVGDNANPLVWSETFTKIKNLRYYGDDLSFYMPSPYNQPPRKFRFNLNMTYFYDVDGTCSFFGEELFDMNSTGGSQLERIWIPGLKTISAGAGRQILYNCRSLKDFVEFPELTGESGATEQNSLYVNGSTGFIPRSNMNNVMYLANKITHLKYPKLTTMGTQTMSSQKRHTHQNMTALERVYLPSMVNFMGYDKINNSDRCFNNVKSGCIFYVPPYLETSRLAEAYIGVLNPQDGDVVTVNGLDYTATTGATVSPFFNCCDVRNIDGNGSVPNHSDSRQLAIAINNDVRTGTIGTVKTRAQYCRNAGTNLTDNFLILQQTLTGASGNATTISVSNATRFPTHPVFTGGTFYSGGTENRNLRYLIDQRSAEIRYVTGTTLPNAVTTLSAVTATTSTIDINFTAPAVADRPIDFYEVWINDGVSTGQTIWQNYLPHQEISGSPATIIGLESGTTYTICVKTADYLYNVSDCSNTITGTTVGDTSPPAMPIISGIT
jgi:hypothetical protein